MEYYRHWLNAQQQQGNRRFLRPLRGRRHGILEPIPPGPPLLDFSSNDYLALSQDPGVIKAASQALTRYGSGAGAARLMSGDLEIYHQLENAVASLKDQEAALLFGSGYMANIGIIPSLAGRGDLLFCDRFNHASIYDGCRLSGAHLHRFRHNDCNHLEDLLRQKKADQRGVVIVESLYSMDGDLAPLADLVTLKERYNCLLLVDEAHATGIYGASGAGLIEQLGLTHRVDLAMGTFSKALGSYGGYVAASRELIDYLLNRARSFIFSTALPPAVAAASLAAVQLVQTEPQLRTRLRAKTRLFNNILLQSGLSSPGPTQIIPIMIGNSSTAMEVAQRLHDENIFATAVRPPTVPANTARLRFSITLHHSDAALTETATTLTRLLKTVK